MTGREGGRGGEADDNDGSGGEQARSGEGDEEEVGAREKSDAVKHSAGRVIRLRKSAEFALLHITGLPFYQVPGYISIRDVGRLNAYLALRLAPAESNVFVSHVSVSCLGNQVNFSYPPIGEPVSHLIGFIFSFRLSF